MFSNNNLTLGLNALQVVICWLLLFLISNV